MIRKYEFRVPPSTDAPTGYLSVGMAAMRLGVSYDAVYRRTKELPHIMVGRMRMFKEDDILKAGKKVKVRISGHTPKRKRH